jgi:hypothetical protein
MEEKWASAGLAESTAFRYRLRRPSPAISWRISRKRAHSGNTGSPISSPTSGVNEAIAPARSRPNKSPRCAKSWPIIQSHSLSLISWQFRRMLNCPAAEVATRTGRSRKARRTTEITRLAHARADDDFRSLDSTPFSLRCLFCFSC